MLAAASQLANSHLGLRLSAVDRESGGVYLAQGDRAVQLIAQNHRGLFAANSVAVARHAEQIDIGWRQFSGGGGSDSPAAATQSPGSPALAALQDSFSLLFAAITTQSLSSDVIADISEVGSDVNYLLSLHRLIHERALISLEPEFLAALRGLVASADKLRARTGVGGKLRGYRVRQLIGEFSAAVDALDPLSSDVADSHSEVSPSPDNQLYGQVEQLRAVLIEALSRYHVIVLALIALLCLCLMAVSLVCLRLWRYQRLALSEYAASSVEATQLKQSWVEQAGAIAAGDCTNRWRATDDTNREIATALNSTTDTICSLVRTQKSAAIELREHTAAIKGAQAQLSANCQARRATLGELAGYFTDADRQVGRARDWVGHIGAIAADIRHQADQLAQGSEQHSAESRVAPQYSQALLRLTDAEQVLEQAVDQIVGVRQITDQSKLLALNVSLQMVADGPDDDMSTELAEQVQSQTALVEAEVTQIERSVRSASDELHASILQLQSEVEIDSASPSAGHADSSARQALIEGLAQGVVELSEISTDLNNFTAQRVSLLQAMQQNLQQACELQDADETLLASCDEWVDRIDAVGDDMRETVAHYVIPVTGR